MNGTSTDDPRFSVLDVVAVAERGWSAQHALVGQRLVVVQVRRNADGAYDYATEGHEGVGVVAEDDLEPTGESVTIEHFGTVPGGLRAGDVVAVDPAYEDADVAGHEAVVEHDWIVEDGGEALVSVWCDATRTSAYVDVSALAPLGRRVEPDPVPRWSPQLDATMQEIEGAGYLVIDEIEQYL